MMWVLVFLPLLTFAQVKTEAFIIQINDRNMKVNAPDKPKKLFSVIVENSSLSDQVGKFTVGKKLLKYVSIRSGKSETVEIENQSGGRLYFVPVSPAFQDVELIFGKKAYEVPSKE